MVVGVVWLFVFDIINEELVCLYFYVVWVVEVKFVFLLDILEIFDFSQVKYLLKQEIFDVINQFKLVIIVCDFMKMVFDQIFLFVDGCKLVWMGDVDDFVFEVVMSVLQEFDCVFDCWCEFYNFVWIQLMEVNV